MTQRLPRLRLDHLEADLAQSLSQTRADDTAVRASRAVVERALGDGKAYYGINTGFGILAQKRIEPNEVERLQTNLLRSHAVGLGSPVPKNVTRLMFRLKIHALALGYSGVAPETLARLALFAERELIPAVPSRGSVGASGDLAPLAHMSLPLIGAGSFWDEAGRDPKPAEQVLKDQGLSPITLRAKDGLALINGTQLMSAYGSFVLARVSGLLKIADVIAASTIEALKGSVVPFDARFHELRAHPGHGSVSSNVRLLLAESQIVESHLDCDKVQDPYSLRCVPQVHGASRDALAYTRQTVECEINSVTDNPIVFPDGAILSGGNFHGQPLALGARPRGDRPGRDRQHRRAAPRPSALGARRSAATASGRHGHQLRADDRAVHRRGSRLGEQDPVPPGVGRLDPDESRPGGPRQHGEHLRHQAPAGLRERRPGAGTRAAGVHAGPSISASRCEPARVSRRPTISCASASPIWITTRCSATTSIRPSRSSATGRCSLPSRRAPGPSTRRLAIRVLDSAVARSSA